MATETCKNEFSVTSIFDVAYQESVAGLLRPAFKHVLKILVNKYPNKLGLLWKYADEICMCCELVLQRHYLNYYNAAISENFYNLKRINVGRSGSSSLTVGQISLSLAALVILPYIKTKLDQVFEKLRDERIRQGQTSEQRTFVRIFLKVYPYFHFALHCPFAVYQLGFTLHLFTHHSPIFHALQMQLVRATDMLDSPTHLVPTPDSLIKRLAMLPVLIIDKVIRVIAVVMPTVLFFLQFLQWWYATDYKVATTTRPPPPEPPKVVDQGCRLPSHPLQCPLCHKVRSNMAALVSSGFVFCYPCVYQYVLDHGQCPVTHYPAHLDQILRIYSL